MKKIASLLAALLICGSTAFAAESANNPNSIMPPFDPKDNVQLNQVFDYVYDPGVYESLDFELGKKVVGQVFGGDGGKCTAVAKTLPNGDTVVGRNLDFYITHNPAYIIRTKGVDGKYATVGVSYAQHFFPNNEYVKANGISKWHRDVLPFSSTDVLNEKGLYCETNMRFDQTDKNGKPFFDSTGTNPKSKENINVMMLPRYLATHCATVDEAVALAKKINISSIKAPGMNWSLCVLMADATGNYGLLEVAKNKVHFLKKQPAQTNFYVTKSLNKQQIYKAGLGRYDTVMAGLKDVKTDEDMFNLIKKVSYWQSNFPDTCQYDARTELVHDNSKWTTAYVLDPKNAEDVKAEQEAGAAKLRAMTREQVMDEGIYWESTLTHVINCNKKTMTVRFFEDDGKTITLGFDK